MNRIRSFRACITLLSALAMAACSQEAMIRRFTPPEADARARAYLAQIARGQADSAEARLAPSVAGPNVHAEFQKIQAVLRGSRFDSLHVVGAQVNTMNGVRHVNLTYEFKGAQGWTLASVATIDEGGQWFVDGLAARAIPEPMERSNAFDMAGKSGLHYLWLVLTLAAALTSLLGAIFIGTRRGMPRRWLWTVVALLGVCAFNLNWADGTVFFQPIQVMLLSAAVLKSGPAAPWTVTFALPLGALIAFLRYRAWRRRTAEAAAAHETGGGGSIATAEAPAAEPTAE